MSTFTYNVYGNVVKPIEEMGYNVHYKGVDLEVEFNAPQIKYFRFPLSIMIFNSVDVYKRKTTVLNGSSRYFYLLKHTSGGIKHLFRCDECGSMEFIIISDRTCIKIFMNEYFSSFLYRERESIGGIWTDINETKCSSHARVYKGMRLIFDSIVDAHKQQSMNGKIWRSFQDETLDDY